MPKISEERRAERRNSIIQAARECFQRKGLHTTTMDDIIRQSGLSAGAVYGYFTSKEQLIFAALTTSMADLGAVLAPIFGRAPPLPPADFVEELTRTIKDFAQQGSVNRMRIAMHGWSEIQHNDALRSTMQQIYRGLYVQLVLVADRWKAAGFVPESALSDDLAASIMSLGLGFVAQAAILGDADPAQHARGLEALACLPPRLEETQLKRIARRKRA